MDIHIETLEEEATHATDEARMVLPGIQAILGFQLIAVFNQRFEDLSSSPTIRSPRCVLDGRARHGTFNGAGHCVSPAG